MTSLSDEEAGRFINFLRGNLWWDQKLSQEDGFRDTSGWGLFHVINGNNTVTDVVEQSYHLASFWMPIVGADDAQRLAQKYGLLEKDSKFRLIQGAIMKMSQS